MKIAGKYTTLLLALLFVITACDDDKAPTETSEEYKTFLRLKQEDSLLKQVLQQEESYIFQFETDTLTIPVNDVIAVETDLEHWNTTLTLYNQSAINIPTLGTSIAAFVSDIRVNPSGFNPLAARIRLGLPCGGRIHAAVVPKEGSKTPVQEHLFDYTHESTQLIDVLGLYADYINKVELTFADKNGKERAKTIIDVKTAAIETRGFLSFNVVTAQVYKMEPGLNLVNSPGEGETDTSVPYMVDADGELRWILLLEKSELEHIGAQCGLHRMRNGNYITGDANYHRIIELDVLGNIVRKWDLKAYGYSYHHEIMEEGNGNFLITVSKNDAKLPNNEDVRVLDHIIEFNPETANIVKEWDIITMLDNNRIVSVDSELPGAASYGQSEKNWLHNNGITEMGEDLLATARWQGIFKYTRDGNLKWVIAPHNDWGNSYRQYLLTPLDKNSQPITDVDVLNGKKTHPDFEWCWGVHCPVSLPNGHIMAFDNGYCRNYVAKAFSEPGQYSRVVEYEINEKNKTIRQVWQYGKDRTDCYAAAMSGVQYLPNTGNRLFSPAMGNRLSDGTYGCRVIEIDPNTNEVVYELEIKGGTHHRANRISLYPQDQSL